MDYLTLIFPYDYLLGLQEGANSQGFTFVYHTITTVNEPKNIQFQTSLLSHNSNNTHDYLHLTSISTCTAIFNVCSHQSPKDKSS